MILFLYAASMFCTKTSFRFILCLALVLSLTGTAHAKRKVPLGSLISKSSGAESTGVGSSGASGPQVLEQISPFSPTAGNPDRFSRNRDKRVRKFSLEPVFDTYVTGGVMTFAW